MNSFGTIFKVSTFGESHGEAVGCVIDGCPSGVEISEGEIQMELDRRKPGQSDISTARSEADECKILSGVFNGRTTGTPICIVVRNTDARSGDYSEMEKLWRPSHADFTYDAKYGFRDWRGGGRSSARETAARVAGGVLAKKLFKGEVELRAWVESVHSISMPHVSSMPSVDEIESNAVRCPHAPTAARMEEFIKKAKAEGDSVGGVVACRASGLEAGLGEPVFDRLDALLAHGMLSIPACKGFEIGSGFAGSRMFGSQHNDEFSLSAEGKILAGKNFAGGVLGGISSGQDLYFRAAFKPTATIAKEQNTLCSNKTPVKVSGKGRHDPCVLPRAVPVVEAMAWLVLADLKLMQKRFY